MLRGFKKYCNIVIAKFKDRPWVGPASAKVGGVLGLGPYYGGLVLVSCPSPAVARPPPAEPHPFSLYSLLASHTFNIAASFARKWHFLLSEEIHNEKLICTSPLKMSNGSNGSGNGCCGRSSHFTNYLVEIWDVKMTYNSLIKCHRIQSGKCFFTIPFSQHNRDCWTASTSVHVFKCHITNCKQQSPLLISRHSLNWKKHDSNIIQYIVHTEPISNPVPPVHSAAPTIHYTNLSKQSCANANIQLYIMSYVKLSTLLAPKSQYILWCTASEFWNIYEKYLTC